MPPAIIAVGIGLAASAAAAAGYIAVSVALAITIGASIAGALLTKAPAFGGYTSQQERKQVLRTSTAPAVTIYGRSVVSGLLFFAEEEAGDSEKEWVHLAICLADHAIEEVEKVWLGDDLIEAYGDLAQYQIHSARTTVDPFMRSKCSSWKDDMIGRNITWARVSLKFNQDKFPAGLPNIKFQIKGKRVYDPRNGSTAWSNNASLCILDYYRTHLQVPDTDINMDMFIQAANVCDQNMNDGGGARKRYTLNGTFDADESQATVLDELHKACAGEPTYMAGKHGILAGAYYGPATMELHSSQIIDDVTITPEASFGEKLNIVTGTFLDPQQQYTEVDYPPVTVQAYIDADGGEYSDDLKLRFVDNEYQAQQLAQIKINRTRVGRTVKCKVNLSGYSYRPGYYVNLFIPEMGINGVEHRITEWSIAATEGVELTLRQETPAVWGDAIGKPIERPDITDFPSVGVAQPANLAFTPTTIGDVVQGIFSWTNTGLYTYNLVYVRKDGNLIRTMQVPGQNTPLNGLPRGDYVLGVAAVGPMGNRSAEATLPVTIAAPAAPTGCDIIQQFFGFTLKPRTGELYNVNTQFDFWTSGETRLPNSATATVEQYATRKGLGRQMADSDLKNNHTYYWYIRAVNIYGMSEFLEVAALCFTEIGDLMDQIDQNFHNTTAYKDLFKPIEMNYLAILQAAAAVGADVDHQFKQQGEFRADVLTIKTTIVDQDKALAELNQQVIAAGKAIDEVTGDVIDLTSTVSQKMTSVVYSNGTAKASYVLNLGINRGGVYYSAGMAIAIEPYNGTYRSTTLFKADSFGFYSGSDPGGYKLALAIYNGQVFIADAMIRDASITNAKIGNQIQSNNWNGSTVGWMINKDGTAYFNNVVVRGTIYANYGELNNVVIRENCTILGTLSAKNIRGNLADVKVVDINGLPNNESHQWNYYFTLNPDPENERVLYITVPMTAKGYYSVGNNHDTSGSASIWLRLYINGVQQPERQVSSGSNGSDSSTVAAYAVNVGVNQTIQIRFQIYKWVYGRGAAAIIEPASMLVTARANSKWQ
jgi:hypothetical protein